MKKTLVTAVITMLASGAFALSTIDWGAGGSNYGVQDPLGNTLLAGGVYMGTLLGSHTTADLVAAWNNGLGSDAAVLADLAIYASGNIGDGGNGNGLFGEPTATSSDNTLFGKQLYYVMTDVAGDLGIATATGNSNWTVPSATAGYPVNYTATGLDDVNVLLIGTFAAADTGGNNPGFPGGIDLAPIIPEPSTFVLVGLGLLGAMGLRRRS